MSMYFTPKANRRNFIRAGLALVSGNFFGKSFPARFESGSIMTVNGLIPASQLGKTLTHEHVLVDFVGARHVNPNRYKRQEVFDRILPNLKKLKAAGIDTFIDATPSFMGRDAALLKMLSDAAGLHIVTNTGYYGAAGGKFLPASVALEDADQVAEHWIKEWENGIDGTGIKPGFMKIAVDKAPFKESICKILHAAATTHLATGLTINIHTGQGGKTAREELCALTAAGVSPEAFVWIHSQNEKDNRYHAELAGAGAWISVDGIDKNNLEEPLRLLQSIKKNGFLHRSLISQDAGWYNVGEPDGGTIRDYNDLPDLFIPLLIQNGFSTDEIHKLLVENPAEAFTIRVKKN